MIITHFQAYAYLGSENIGQIWICLIITFAYVFFHHVESFVLLFILIIL